MPYKKYSGSRYYKKNKRRYDRVKKVSKVANKALKLAKSVNQAMELKFITKLLLPTNAASALTYTPYRAELIDITQGDSHNNRLGGEVILKRFLLRGIVDHSVTTELSHYEVVRITVILFRGRGSGANFPAWSDIFLGTLNDPITPLAFFSSDYKSHYKILFDKLITMPDARNTANFYKVDVPLNERIRFDATADTESSDTSVVMFASSNINPADADNTKPQFYYIARLYFVDP